MRSLIYRTRVFCRTKDGERAEVPKMLVNEQIRGEMTPILLGDNLLHSIGSAFHCHLLQESHDKRITHRYFMPAYKCRFINEANGSW